MLGFDESPKSIQNRELELQLDAVQSTLIRRLDRILIGIFRAQERDIHDDHQDINEYQMQHDAADLLLFDFRNGSEHLPSFPDVKS